MSTPHRMIEEQADDFVCLAERSVAARLRPATDVVVDQLDG